MRDYKVNVIGLSPKINRPNIWSDVDADKYTVDENEFIKVYLTNHDLQHRNFTINGGMIVLGDDVYAIQDVIFDQKRPKYANCLVTKVAG